MNFYYVLANIVKNIKSVIVQDIYSIFRMFFLLEFKKRYFFNFFKIISINNYINYIQLY